MRALPARRIALGACCAALLVGITGPAATAADPARERTPVTSSEALLVQVRSLDAQEGELAPVVDLLEAVLEADGGHLPPAEAKRLGEAAEAALEEAAAKAAATEPEPGTTATPAASDPATTAVTPEATPEAMPEVPAPEEGTPLTDEADLASELLDTVREAVDDLLERLLSDAEEDTAEELSSVDELLAEVAALLDALRDTGPQASTLPAPAGTVPVTQVPLLPAVTLPAPVLLLPPAP
ncbi:hypothetical protein [Streptomyces sp. Tu 3180]|uniref:hypothetical protein n=1 Tax=Streptomyces sp. Tu 3180 TaxID=2682611 RepID=UPI001356A24A|nr:hypothetical protein [Streptomyces sp. Tu 3180]KAF3465483.1 hypothetical protein GL259_14825 [Streptomyces sp. Tu 3180]